MGVGPTEGPSQTSPPARIDRKSGPASAAPAAGKPLPTNVTPGNLVSSRSRATTKSDGDISTDVREVEQATATFSDAWHQGNVLTSKAKLESAGQALSSAQDKLNRDVNLALTARLPKFNPESFDRQIDAIAADMAARYGGGLVIREALAKAKVDVEQSLPDAQHAALIMGRILKNDSLEQQFFALNSVYSHSGFKTEIRKDPGYQKIIAAKVKDCFVDKSVRPESVRAVIDDWKTQSDIKQDFLSAVEKYAKANKIVLPDLELKSLWSIVLGGPL